MEIIQSETVREGLDLKRRVHALCRIRTIAEEAHASTCAALDQHIAGIKAALDDLGPAPAPEPIAQAPESHAGPPPVAAPPQPAALSTPPPWPPTRRHRVRPEEKPLLASRIIAAMRDAGGPVNGLAVLDAIWKDGEDGAKQVFIRRIRDILNNNPSIIREGTGSHTSYRLA